MIKNEDIFTRQYLARLKGIKNEIFLRIQHLKYTETNF